jgi:hypothetical protein
MQSISFSLAQMILQRAHIGLHFAPEGKIMQQNQQFNPVTQPMPPMSKLSGAMAWCYCVAYSRTG